MTRTTEKITLSLVVLAEVCVMGWWKGFEKGLHWAEHIKLLFDVVTAVAGWNATKAALTHLTHIPSDVISAIAWSVAALILCVLPLLFRIQTKTGDSASPPQASGVVPGIPTLSALLGQNPTLQFDAKTFFAQAYYSPVTAEGEKNIKTIAQQSSPNDKEAFYARFIGIGLVAYQHDQTWLMIFGSQIAALGEMNSRGLIPLADLKKHYNSGAASNPAFYANYTFDQWVEFMKIRLLIAVYPSLMVELSWGGKDFLKYLAHAGRNTTVRPN